MPAKDKILFSEFHNLYYSNSYKYLICQWGKLLRLHFAAETTEKRFFEMEDINMPL